MDNFTYGDSLAAIRLSRLVEKNSHECKHLSIKVGRIWSDFTTGIKTIARSNINSSFKEHLIDTWYMNHKIRITKTNIPNVVKSYLLNISHAKYSDIKKCCKNRKLVKAMYDKRIRQISKNS